MGPGAHSRHAEMHVTPTILTAVQMSVTRNDRIPSLVGTRELAVATRGVPIKGTFSPIRESRAHNDTAIHYSMDLGGAYIGLSFDPKAGLALVWRDRDRAGVSSSRNVLRSHLKRSMENSYPHSTRTLRVDDLMSLTTTPHFYTTLIHSHH